MTIQEDQNQELHLELLLGRRVHDASGHCIGRIEEVRAEQQGEDWVIVEYLIGIEAIFERLSAWNLGRGLLHFLGAHKLYGGHRIPWHQLDLTDPDRPHLTCTLEELKTISQELNSNP